MDNIEGEGMARDGVLEKVAREICRQSATSLYGRWSSDPKENQTWFRRAKQILDIEPLKQALELLEKVGGEGMEA